MFYRLVPKPIADINTLPQSDAVVVFTGGFQRIIKGVELLKMGKGDMLFISGVAQESTKNSVLGNTLAKQINLQNVFLGHAKNTQENAQEVVAWTKENNVQSIILVTSHYHMPRSLREINILDHDLKIIPCAVNLPNQTWDTIAYYYISDFIKFTLLKWGIKYPDEPSRF